MELLNYAPKTAFNQRHLLTLGDWTQDEIMQTLSLALKLKHMQKTGQPHAYLAGKTLGMVFTKSSTRTRVSFEVGMLQLGGHALFLSANDIQIGRGETIEDTARVLSRYVDGHAAPVGQADHHLLGQAAQGDTRVGGAPAHAL